MGSIRRRVADLVRYGDARASGTRRSVGAKRRPSLLPPKQDLPSWQVIGGGGYGSSMVHTVPGSPAGARHYSHQSMRPPRSQKCERHPVRRHTEGLRVGRPRALILMSQRGTASRISSSSSGCRHPHGQRMPTHQSSSASRARTTSRHGSPFGRLSPSMMRNRRTGSIRDVRRRHQRGHLMRPHSSVSARETAARGAVRASHARGVSRCRSL